MPGTLMPLLGLNVRVQVHPVVLLSICDAYIRRNDKQERVIGTLLGSVADGLVSVQRCYVVPHNESADQASGLFGGEPSSLCWGSLIGERAFSTAGGIWLAVAACSLLLCAPDARLPPRCAALRCFAASI